MGEIALPDIDLDNLTPTIDIVTLKPADFIKWDMSEIVFPDIDLGILVPEIDVITLKPADYIKFGDPLDILIPDLINVDVSQGLNIPPFIINEPEEYVPYQMELNSAVHIIGLTDFTSEVATNLNTGVLDGLDQVTSKNMMINDVVVIRGRNELASDVRGTIRPGIENWHCNHPTTDLPAWIPRWTLSLVHCGRESVVLPKMPHKKPSKTSGQPCHYLTRTAFQTPTDPLDVFIQEIEIDGG